MFWDEEYIDEMIEELKKSIENNTFKKDSCNNFISYDELEDEFSHTEIRYAQEMLMQKAKEYLSVNYSGRYAMWCDWCVHIATVETYREIMWGKANKYREEYVKLRENRDIIKQVIYKKIN